MNQKIIRFFACIFLICTTFILAGCDPSAIGGQLIRLENPTDFQVNVGDNISLTWSEVEGASMYSIYIYQEDTCILTENAESGYIIKGLEPGVYKVGIRTIGDSETYRSSAVSDLITFEVTESDNPVTTPLTTPTNVLVDYDQDGKKIRITFKDSADYVNATGYLAYFYQNGQIIKTIQFAENGSSINIDSLTAGTYVVEVKVLGDNILYSNSEVSNSKASVTLVETGGGTDIFEGYYADASNKIGDALEEALRTIITNTHKIKTSYGDLRKFLQVTDRDPNNSNNIILFYCRASVRGQWDSAKTWNREHVWPDSQGVGEEGPGSDAHHLRPTNPSINSSRGNNGFDYVTGGKELQYGGKGTGCYVGGGKFEPADCIKGDVARIIFYMLIRYKNLYSKLPNVASIDVMLEWNSLDPVDSTEIQRNEEVYKIQGNRNPLIDHPEFAQLIWAN